MKILVAVDASPGSIVARDLVASLPWPADTHITLLAAYQAPVDWTGGIGSTMAWVGDVEDAVRDDLADRLRELATPLDGRGWTIDSLVVRGRAATAIIETARERAVDLVVTGSRGHGTLRSMLLGSVANEVAGGAPCPVLVARTPSVSRLVVATDGSKGARAVPDALAAMGVFNGMRADAVAVTIPDHPGFETAVTLYTLGNEQLAEQRRQLHRQFAVDATEMRERLTELGMEAVDHVRAGDPAREIIGLAEEREADLIVTGTRGLSGMERLLLGSVARNVLTHARCSVLIVRNDEPLPTQKESQT